MVRSAAREFVVRPAPPALDDVLGLPSLSKRVIPEEWEDFNGHVNIQHYMALYDDAGWPLASRLGLNESYFKQRRRGLFDLEHHIRYLAELHVADTVTVHVRLLDRNAKRFHGMMFVVNRSRERVASTLEFITSSADLQTRKTAPFPPDIAAALDDLIGSHVMLAWRAPVCGAMSV